MGTPTTYPVPGVSNVPLPGPNPTGMGLMTSQPNSINMNMGTLRSTFFDVVLCLVRVSGESSCAVRRIGIGVFEFIFDFLVGCLVLIFARCYAKHDEHRDGIKHDKHAKQYAQQADDAKLIGYEFDEQYRTHAEQLENGRYVEVIAKLPC